MKKTNGQYFTPAWAAEELWDLEYSNLDPHKTVIWEPTCGTGNMLAAIPETFQCIGSELDPELAQIARTKSTRQVITGNCLDLTMNEYGITHVFGNPPFFYDSLFKPLMDKCTKLIPIGGFAGFILPAYFFQTSRTVKEINRNWTLHQHILPRCLFPNLSKPLIWAKFIRENNPKLFGFLLFPQTADIKELPIKSQELLSTQINGSRGLWKEVVGSIINELGGEVDLKAIYKAIEGKRPTPNTWWKEKVRQTLQRSFKRVSKGVYSR